MQTKAYHIPVNIIPPYKNCSNKGITTTSLLLLHVLFRLINKVCTYDAKNRMPIQTGMFYLSQYSINVQFNHVLSTWIVLRLTMAVLWINYTTKTMQRHSNY